MSIKDLTGEKFGRLTVLRRAPNKVGKDGRRRVQWVCQCECRNEVTVLGDNLKGGKSNSCGCLSKEANRNNFSTHGETHTKLYGVWCAIKRRCNNPNAAYYDSYGGRGICVCSDWSQSYETFRDWAIASGYCEGLTIDRIDVNGNYEPSNCRWVGSDVQANNRRSNRLITYNGETHTMMEWSKILNIGYKKLSNRIYSGWSIERAFTT